MAVVVNLRVYWMNSLNKTPPTERTCATRLCLIPPVIVFIIQRVLKKERTAIMSSIVGILIPDFRPRNTSSLLFVSILSKATPSWPKGKRSIVISSSHLQNSDSGGRSLIPSGWLCGYSFGWWGHGIAQQPPTAPPLGPHHFEMPYNSFSWKLLWAVLR